MKLYGRTWTRREIEARVGRIEQIGGVRRFHWDEGREAGSEQIEVRTGAGLRYLVSPSRALDISLAEFGGVPLSWQSQNGDAHPAYYDDEGLEWLRTAVGGLLMTCGLSYAGAPGEDEGEAFGLHGRIHHLPAHHIASEGYWRDDEYHIRIAGTVSETRIFGESLHLRRTIHSRLGENSLTIRDVVENNGFSEAPLMLLYHFNFGFPLLTEKTKVDFPSQRIVARDEGVPVDGYERWQTPEADFSEWVYYHEGKVADEDGRLAVSLHNPEFPAAGGGARPLTVRLSWYQEQLPRLIQWKMPGAGTHVLGIEPANCYVEGRAKERAQGTLEMLPPGASREFELKLEII